MNAISRLFTPRSVAVIGASADAGKTAGRPVAYLRKHGFSGAIYPVNPRVERIGDLRCYPDIASLPEAPDVAMICLGAERANQAVRELAAKGTAAAIVLASGYGETGEAGQRRQRELQDAAGTMRILGPNTIGLVNLTDDIPLSASGALEMDRFPTGAIGLVSQSGGILGALLSRAAACGIGMSKLVSTSNEVDLELADFIDHLVDDEATRVIALYVEAVRNPEKFRTACLRAAEAGKPVVAFKIGRSEAGARAAVSHTGALAGADRMYDALFRQVGVIRAQTFADFLDIPAGLATGRRLADRRVAVLTSTGGAGTLVSDALGVSGFETPAPDQATAERLRALQSGDEAALDRNPIDVTLAGLKPDLLRGAINALLDSSTYDALIVIVGSSALAMPELMVGAIKDCMVNSTKPILAYVSPHAPNLLTLLNESGVPAYSAPESCAAVLDALLRVSAPAAATAATVRPPAPVSLDGLPSGSLDEAQAKALFARFGVPGVRERVVATPEEAATAAVGLGERVVLKILSNEITHKSDVGGVAVGVPADAVAGRLHEMAGEVKRRAGVIPEHFLVQEMVAGGTEIILGLHRDPLGTAVLLGMGGVLAELFKDTTLRLVPPGGLERPEALAMIRELKSWPLLDGYRGRPKGDVDALADAVVAFSQLADQLGDRLVEAEINPIFVLPTGQGVKAADGVAVIGR